MMFFDISEGKCPSYLKVYNAAYREENMNVQGQAPIEPHCITTTSSHTLSTVTCK